MTEIVLAFTPSKSLKDWTLRYDDEWFYEPIVRFYDLGCKKLDAYCKDHRRNVGKEPYYDLKEEAIVPAPRVYLTERPDSYSFKTIDEVRKSSIFKEK